MYYVGVYENVIFRDDCCIRCIPIATTNTTLMCMHLCSYYSTDYILHGHVCIFYITQVMYSIMSKTIAIAVEHMFILPATFETHRKW